MESTSRRKPGRSQPQPLSEAVGKVPFGTMVGWRTPGGEVYGVVVGREEKELLVVTAYDKTLMRDKGIRFYRDDALSGKLTPLLPTLRMSVQRVPAAKAFKHSRVTGAALRPYSDAAKQLQTEGTMIEQSRWIQGAVKHPGRLKKILGVTDEEWSGLSKKSKLKMINDALKGNPGDSERGALLLGKRFIGGEFKRRREDVFNADTIDLLRSLNESVEDDITEEEMAESTRKVLHWVKQKYGAAKMAAHRAFLKMVRKDPAAHRRKMRQDKKYHRTHKWHDKLMRKTARPGWARRHIRAGVEIPDDLMPIEERDPGQAFMDLPFELRVTERSDPSSMKVQTLIFAKSHFDRASAKKWAKSHGFKSGKVDEKTNTYRLRQRDPGEFETFRTISFKPGLKAVVAKI